jgi:hypothetical protein
MIDVRTDPWQYLALPAAAFWRWDRDATALAWAQSETTIAFRSELEQVLRMMLRDGFGLPPLSLVLLVLASTRDSWADTVQREDDSLRQFALSTAGLHERSVTQLQQGLARIAALPVDLRHSIEGKCQLLEFLFETGGACFQGESAERACDMLAVGREALRRQAAPHDAATEDVCRAFPVLLGGLARLDAVKLRLRNDTGLDTLPMPADVTVDVWKAARELVASLSEDEQWGGLARLARALMAVVHLPRPLLEPEDLPLGGFTDIENRGSFDRLLTSELAHDELTLAVRIALGEALYLRRETPPKTPSLARSILLDVGIRMWGMPRLFSTAVALALVATAEHHAAATVYCAKGSLAEEVDLTTRAGLTEQLARLELDIHAGEALPAFLKATERELMRSDRIIVTSVAGAGDPDFLRCLDAHQISNLFLAIVDQQGAFQLLQRGPHGNKLICEAHLDLDRILASPKGSVSLIGSQQPFHPPAIFREQTFPLLVPCNRFNSPCSWTASQQGVYEIAADQRLLYWDSKRHGPRQISEYLPCAGAVCWSAIDPGGDRAAVVLGAPGRNYQFAKVRRFEGVVENIRLDLVHPTHTEPYSFFVQRDMVMAVRKDEIVVFNWDGIRVTSLSVSQDVAVSGVPLRHVRDRYFVDDQSGAWFALSAAAPVEFTPVFDPSANPGIKLITMFDGTGREGPVGLTGNGCLYFPDRQRTIPLSKTTELIISRVLEVSDCGEWIAVECISGSRRHRALISTVNETVRFVGEAGARQVSFERCVSLNRNVALHRKFSGISALVDDSALALISTKGLVWLIEFRDGAIRLRPNADVATERCGEFIMFQRPVKAAQRGYKLHCADGPAGTRFVLDSRGLLHLCWDEGDLPDTTLVLVDGEMAGWCEGGHVWGNPYFTGMTSRGDPRAVFEEVIQPFAELFRI